MDESLSDDPEINPDSDEERPISQPVQYSQPSCPPLGKEQLTICLPPRPRSPPFYSMDSNNIHQILQTRYQPGKSARPYPTELDNKAIWTEQQRKLALKGETPVSFDDFAKHVSLCDFPLCFLLSFYL